MAWLLSWGLGLGWRAMVTWAAAMTAWHAANLKINLPELALVSVLIVVGIRVWSGRLP